MVRTARNLSPGDQGQRRPAPTADLLTQRIQAHDKSTRMLSSPLDD